MWCKHLVFVCLCLPGLVAKGAEHGAPSHKHLELRFGRRKAQQCGSICVRHHQSLAVVSADRLGGAGRPENDGRRGHVTVVRLGRRPGDKLSVGHHSYENVEREHNRGGHPDCVEASRKAGHVSVLVWETFYLRMW